MRIINKIIELFYIKLYKSRWSKDVIISGEPVLNQPLLICGEGKVVFNEKVRIGYRNSQGFYNTYSYFDLRGEKSLISLGDDVMINNNSNLTADNASIHIGKGTLIGVNLNIQTSDGHCLSPGKRHDINFPRYSVVIGENVFIGDNVTILKGVNIGKNAVIGAGSVVTSNIPENVMAAGNPCIVKRLLS